MKGQKHNFTEQGKKSLSDYAKSRPVWFKGKHHTEETKKILRQKKLGKQGKNNKEVYVLNTYQDIIQCIRSRKDTFQQYSNIKEYKIKQCLKSNSKIQTIQDLVYYNNISFIYKKDYNKINSQSTIETITLDEANVKME